MKNIEFKGTLHEEHKELTGTFHEEHKELKGTLHEEALGDFPIRMDFFQKKS